MKNETNPIPHPNKEPSDPNGLKLVHVTIGELIGPGGKKKLNQIVQKFEDGEDLVVIDFGPESIPAQPITPVKPE